jgi:hypothetical protein
MICGVELQQLQPICITFALQASLVNIGSRLIMSASDMSAVSTAASEDLRSPAGTNSEVAKITPKGTQASNTSVVDTTVNAFLYPEAGEAANGTPSAILRSINATKEEENARMAEEFNHRDEDIDDIRVVLYCC